MFDYNEDPHGPTKQVPHTRSNRAVVEVPNLKIPDSFITIIGTAVYLSEYTAINLSFIEYKEWKSYIEVKAYVRQTEPIEADKDLVVAEFRFDREYLNPGDISIEAVDIKTTAYIRYQPLRELIIGRELWKLRLKYDTKLLHKGSLIRDKFSGRSYPVLKRLYEYLDIYDKVQFLIKGGKHVYKQFVQ